MRPHSPFPKAVRLLLASIFISLPGLAAEVSGTSSLSQLQGALRTNAAAAVQAAQAIAKMGPSAKPAIGDLVSALRYDEDTVTAPVGDALLAIGPDSVPVLLSCLKDGNLFVRQRGAIVLGRFGPRAKAASTALTQLVLDPTYQVSSAATKALVQIGPDALPAITSVFNHQDEKSQVALMDVVDGMGAPAIPFLLRCLAKSDSIYVRAKAAELLGTIQPTTPETISGLVDALNNLDERVRLAAVDGLTGLGIKSKAAIGALIVASQTDSDPLVRQKSLDAIPAIGPATAVSLPGLGRALHSPQVEVRTAAVTALAGCKEDPVHTESLLQAAARDSDPGVQAIAQNALKHLPSTAAPTSAPIHH